MARIPLHYKLADDMIELFNQGTHRKATQERVENGTIEQVPLDISSFQLNGEIFISSASVYKDLPLSAVKLVIRIQEELVMNNPLWYCSSDDKGNGSIQRGLAALKRKQIIKQVGKTDIFIVNPAMIRKGRALSVLGALYTYAKRQWEADKKWRPTTVDIRRLMAPDNLALPYNPLNNGQS